MTGLCPFFVWGARHSSGKHASRSCPPEVGPPICPHIPHTFRPAWTHPQAHSIRGSSLLGEAVLNQFTLSANGRTIVTSKYTSVLLPTPGRPEEDADQVQVQGQGQGRGVEGREGSQRPGQQGAGVARGFGNLCEEAEGEGEGEEEESSDGAERQGEEGSAGGAPLAGALPEGLGGGAAAGNATLSGASGAPPTAASSFSASGAVAAAAAASGAARDARAGVDGPTVNGAATCPAGATVDAGAAGVAAGSSDGVGAAASGPAAGAAGTSLGFGLQSLKLGPVVDVPQLSFGPWRQVLW